MRDYEISVLDQYHIEVNSTRKIRGAVLCGTNQGWLLLKEAVLSKKRVPMLWELHAQLEESGYGLADCPIHNKEGELISTAEDGTNYMLKKWYLGKECDIRKSYELQEVLKNLAGIHNCMQGILELDDFPLQNLADEYLRHNRELKKVRSFIRSKVGKGEFETAFLDCFEPMYEWAESVYNQFANSSYEKLYQEALETGTITHGDYNYHNLILTENGIATTNFEHFCMDIQVSDLYYFLRKALEKHQWDSYLGDHMLNAYNAVKPLSQEELQYIGLRLAYPEKFWKLANSYYRSNKAWIPVKNLEKLQTAIAQTEEKRQFLQNIFAFHL